MKYKHSPAPFFNHFIPPSPPTVAKLKSLHCVFRGQLSGPIPLWLASHLIASNPPPNLYALSSPINMTSMIRQNTKFPPAARLPRQT